MSLARIGVYETVTEYRDGTTLNMQEKNNDFLINVDDIVTIGFYGSRAIIRMHGVNDSIEVDADEARELVSFIPSLDIPELLERERRYEKERTETGENA